VKGKIRAVQETEHLKTREFSEKTGELVGDSQQGEGRGFAGVHLRKEQEH